MIYLLNRLQLTKPQSCCCGGGSWEPGGCKGAGEVFHMAWKHAAQSWSGDDSQLEKHTKTLTISPWPDEFLHRALRKSFQKESLKLVTYATGPGAPGAGCGGEYHVEIKGELRKRPISQMPLVSKGWNFSKGLLRQMTTHCVSENIFR